MTDKQNVKLEKILKTLPDMDKKTLNKTISYLESLGIEAPQVNIRRPGAYCPFLETHLVSPCSLEKCKYHIKNEWSRNCLLEYIDVQGNDTFSPAEISFIYDVPLSAVEKSLEKGMEALRRRSEQTVGFKGNFVRKTEEDLRANLAPDDTFNVTFMTLSPPFMKDVNEALETVADVHSVSQHPAVRILGILDTIITELE